MRIDEKEIYLLHYFEEQGIGILHETYKLVIFLQRFQLLLVLLGSLPLLDLPSQVLCTVFLLLLFSIQVCPLLDTEQLSISCI